MAKTPRQNSAFEAARDRRADQERLAPFTRIVMRNAKLIHFLRRLPPQELAALKVYLQCPLFEDRRGLSRLLAALEAECLAGTCEDDAPTHEKIYRHVYGDRPFHAPTLRTSLSQLLAALREFMAWSQFRQDAPAQQRYFLKRLHATEDGRYFDTYHACAVKELAQSGLDHVAASQEHMLLDAARMDHEKQQTGRVSPPTVKAATDNLEQGLMAQLLRSQFESSLSGEPQPPSPFMAALLQALDAQAHTLPAQVQVYHRLCKAMTAPDAWADYQAAKTVCAQAAPTLSPSERRAMQAACLDFACQRLAEGDAAFVAEVWASYEPALRAGLFFHDSGMRAPHFRAFLVAGLCLGERAWAAALHQQWRGGLLGDADGHADRLAQALLAFHGGDFGMASRLLHAVLAHSDDVHDAVYARLYLAMSQYETGETQVLESLCHSFRMFLGRSRAVSATQRARCIAFLNHLRRFLNTPLTDQRRLGKLRAALQPGHVHALVYPWLLEKVAGCGLRRADCLDGALTVG